MQHSETDTDPSGQHQGEKEQTVSPLVDEYILYSFYPYVFLIFLVFLLY